MIYMQTKKDLGRACVGGDRNHLLCLDALRFRRTKLPLIDGLEVGVKRLGVGVQGSGLRVRGLRSRVEVLGLRIED